MRRTAVAPVVATLAAAALLSGAAVYTVERAGCDDPGRYVHIDSTIELVGGCVEPGDLPIGTQAPSQPDQDVTQVRP